MSEFGNGTRKQELYDHVKEFLDTEEFDGIPIEEVVDDVQQVVGYALRNHLCSYKKIEDNES